MKLILASDTDPAAKNIFSRLMESQDFEESAEDSEVMIWKDIALTRIQGGVTSLTDLPLPADEVIVASRHASESGKPSLTTHVPGEPDNKELAIAAPFTLKTALRELNRANEELKLGWDVSLEATHHGPTGLSVPVTFVEIGSSPKQWKNPKAGKVAAHAVMAAAENRGSGRTAIGLGGTHYARKHTRVTLRTDVGIGHIFPKYQTLDKLLLEEALERTSGENPIFALDWKGLTSDLRDKIQGIASELGVEVVRERDLLSEKKV